MAEFDRHADGYDRKIDKSVSFSGRDHDYFTAVKADVILSALDTRLSPTAIKVLDLGCGTATIHRYLNGALPGLVGVDVSGESLKVAAQQQPTCTFLKYDGNKLPFADSTFDAAFSICVVHHVTPEARAGFFDELYRVLRPGGLGIIIEHNPYNPLTRHVVNTCELDRDAVLLRATECQGWLKGAGFTQTSANYFLFTPFEGAFFRHLESALKWLPLGAQYVAMTIHPESQT
jgi:SAM-dependent methyltransferase